LLLVQAGSSNKIAAIKIIVSLSGRLPTLVMTILSRLLSPVIAPWG